MKKIIFLAVIIILIFCSVTAYADGFTLAVDNATAKAGETIAVNLTFSENPGIIAALFELSYDKDRLTLINAEDKKLLPGAVFSQTYEKHPYIMLWNSSSAKNFTENGILVTLTFKVNNNAESGDAYVNISYIPDNVYNVDLINVDLNVVNGIVSVEGKPQQNIETEAPTPVPVVPDSAPSDTNTTPPTAEIPSSGASSNSSSSGVTSVPKDSPTSTETPKNKIPFADVNKTNWYYDAVSYVFENGLMKGTTDTDFSPELPLTRGMLVTVLHRIEGSPHVAENSKFTDVDKEVYYANAVNWAKQNGIVNGITENEFAPDTNITREQIVIILYRYSLMKKYTTNTSPNAQIDQYNDFSAVSEYATQAMQYAIESGLIKGDASGNLNPQGLATRAEIATILYRFIKKI